MANRIMLKRNILSWGRSNPGNCSRSKGKSFQKSIRLLGSGSDQIRSHRKGDRRS